MLGCHPLAELLWSCWGLFTCGLLLPVLLVQLWLAEACAAVRWWLLRAGELPVGQPEGGASSPNVPLASLPDKGALFYSSKGCASNLPGNPKPPPSLHNEGQPAETSRPQR